MKKAQNAAEEMQNEENTKNRELLRNDNKKHHIIKWSFRKLILSIDELINEKYLPVGISLSNMNKTTADIIKWWAGRRIPAALRKNLCKNDQLQKNDFASVPKEFKGNDTNHQ